jgi:hypothetical protein
VMNDRRIPRLSDVVAAERSVSKTRCVGRIGRWERRYAFAARHSPTRLDTGTIEFALRSPHDGVLPGRHRVSPGHLFTVDDGFFTAASGTYSIRTHKVTFAYCGSNHPGQPKRPRP